MMRSFECRLIPTKAQRLAFDEILNDSRETYNAALQERRDAWAMQRKRITYFDQCIELTELRKDARFAVIAARIQREPLRRVDLAFKAFFRRCKSGENPGFPRFKSRDRYNSFAWTEPCAGASFVHVPNIGRVKFKAHRPWHGEVRQIVIKRIGGKWIARLACDIGTAPDKCSVSRSVGIDVGITTLATLSDGTEIQNPRFIRKHAAAIACAQNHLASKKRGSKNRLRVKEKVRREYQRMADARKNYCHHVSKKLVSTYDLIAHENLQIRNMTRGNLAKSILDAAWGILLFQLTYKAENAGKWVIPVDPRNTSQQCSGCGVIVRKKLYERHHICPCGTSLGRDHNAALNISRLGRSLAGSLAGGPLGSLPHGTGEKP